MGKGQGLYQALKSIDVVGPVAHRFTNGDYSYNKAGKIQVRRYPNVKKGFIFSKMPEGRNPNCLLWLNVCFLNYGVVSPECQQCFKVVAKPKTLKQLFAIRDLQEKMDIPSKCGIETRPYVNRPYCGYWYAPLGCTLEEAQALHLEVARRVQFEVGADVDVILKKACTEMEQRYGDTKDWDFPIENEEMYNILKDSYDIGAAMKKEPPMQEVYTMLQWIQFAADRQDPTVHKYLDGATFDTPYHDYQLERKIELLEEVK